MKFVGGSGKKYEDVKLLSADGGMGIVFLARRDDGKLFVRKQIVPVSETDLLRDEKFRRFRLEQEVLQRVSDVRLPNGDGTVRFEEPVNEPEDPAAPLGRSSYIMEYLEPAVDLERWRQQNLSHYGPAAAIAGAAAGDVEWVRRTAGIAVRVLDVLTEVHTRQVLHRDMKPQNVILCINPNTGKMTVHILDFGIAKLMDRESSVVEDHRTNLNMGTENYSAPEQKGDRPDQVDYRADVYGAAMTLGELLMGRHPKKGPRDRVTDFTPLMRYATLHDCLVRAVADDRRERPSLAMLRGAFRQVADQREAPYQHPIRVADGLVVAWRPRPAPPGSRHPVEYEPVLVNPTDAGGMTFGVGSTSAGMVVRCRQPIEIVVRAAGLRERRLMAHDGMVIPWIYAIPGAWHDVMPVGVNEPNVRVKVPHVDLRGAAALVRASPGLSGAWWIAAVRVQPDDMDVSFWRVRMSDLHVEPIPASCQRDAAGAVWTIRDPVRVSSVEVLVVWSVLAGRGVIGAFRGGERVVEMLSDGGQFVREQEVAVRIRAASLPAEITSDWPWTLVAQGFADACLQKLDHPALAEVAQREVRTPEVRADPGTWVAAWRVAMMVRDRGAHAFTQQDLLDIFQTIRLQPMEDSEIALHPAAPPNVRLAIGGATRITALPPHGRIAKHGDIVPLDALNTEADIFRASAMRSEGSTSGPAGPAVEIGWLDGHGVGTLLRLFRPQSLTVGRWDRETPPHLGLFLSDRVSRQCLGVSSFSDRLDVRAVYPDYVRVQLDATPLRDVFVPQYRYLVDIVDPVLQRRCVQCEGRFDSLRERCPRHTNAYARLDYRPAKRLRVNGYFDPTFGPGASIALTRGGLTTVAATGWVQLAPGVFIHIGLTGGPQLRLVSVSASVDGAQVPAGVTRALPPGTLTVQDYGIRARVVFNESMR